MKTEPTKINDLYTITNQIIRDASVPLAIAKSRFQVIADIQNDAENFCNKSWENALKSKDPYICCAILESLYAPSEIKKQTIDIMLKKMTPSHFCKKFVIPFIFSENNEAVHFLTHDVSATLVSQVDIASFNIALHDYLENHPYTQKLPFAESHIEELLLEKLLAEKPPTDCNYNFYKLIEYYSDEDSLKEIIEDLNSHNEYIITAIMNNKNLSNEYRTEAFMVGPDVSLTSSYCNNEQVKIVYESVIYAAHRDNHITAKLNAATCINQLVQHSLLPESCEIDLWKHMDAREISVKTETYQTFFVNTKNQTLLEEALKSDKIFAIVDASKNPYAPKSEKIMALKRCLKALEIPLSTTEWHKITNFDKLDFFTACVRDGLPEESLYDSVLDNINGVDRTVLKEEISLSPNTPISVLDKLEKEQHLSAIISAYIYFNHKSRNIFSESNTHLFLDTICAISEMKTYGAEGYSKIRPKHFFPDIATNDSLLLTNLLEEVIKDGPELAQSYAEIYLNTLKKKQDLEQAQIILSSNPIEIPNNASIELLQELKRQIQDQLLLKDKRSIDIYGEHKTYKNLDLTHTYYDMYKVYSDGIRYATLYSDIDNQIKEQKKTTIKSSKNLYKERSDKDEL